MWQSGHLSAGKIGHEMAYRVGHEAFLAEASMTDECICMNKGTHALIFQIFDAYL